MNLFDNETFDKPRRWWQSRQPREQLMLAVMSVAIGIFLLWSGAIVPLRHAHDAAMVHYDRAVTDLRETEHAVAMIAALQAQRPAPPASDAFASTIVEAATATQVPITRQRTDDAGVFTLGIDAVDTPALLAWLEGLHRQHGIAPSTLDISERNGRLQVQASFSPPPP